MRHKGFSRPNRGEHYTTIPNIFFESDVLGDLREAELKILLVIFRNTYGYVVGFDFKGSAIFKEVFLVTTRQLAQMTGLAQKSISISLRKLIEKGYILKINDGKSIGYRVRIKGEAVGNPNDVEE